MAENTMDEQWLKSNTDCINFIANPLTCNKGIECEFRHSKMARLNPRECRYWFSGNCVNPHCAFRHPPLDDGPNDGSAAPVNKLNVPCYFFLKGFCNKGQSCLFLHELDNANWESTKTVHDAVNVQLDDKIAMGSDIILTPPIKTCANPSAYNTRPIIDNKEISVANNLKSTAPFITHTSPLEYYPHGELVEKNTQSTLQNVSKHITDQQSSEPLFEDDTISKLNFPLPSKELTKKTSSASSEQSSDDRARNGTEQEEWESSPSFDVQVNEYDADGFSCKFDEVNGSYSYENMDLNLLYPDESIMYENRNYHSYDHFDVESPLICANKSPSHVRNRELDFLHSQRWTSLRSRRAAGIEDLRDRLKKRRLVNDNEDLRDHLNKRRLMNGNYQDCFSSSTSTQNEERHQNPVKHPRGRLASQVVISDVGSHVEHRSFKKSSTQQRIPRCSKRRSGKKQSLNSRKPFDEICEKREIPDGAGEEEFQGPKSLNEILKEKRMLRSEVSGL